MKYLVCETVYDSEWLPPARYCLVEVSDELKKNALKLASFAQKMIEAGVEDPVAEGYFVSLEMSDDENLAEFLDQAQPERFVVSDQVFNCDFWLVELNLDEFDTNTNYGKIVVDRQLDVRIFARYQEGVRTTFFPITHFS